MRGSARVGRLQESRDVLRRVSALSEKERVADDHFAARGHASVLRASQGKQSADARSGFSERERDRETERQREREREKRHAPPRAKASSTLGEACALRSLS